jgi:Uma2 family endonuclease
MVTRTAETAEAAKEGKTLEALERLIVAELPRWIAEHPTLRARLRAALAGDENAAPLRMTYAEFLAWADEDTLAEWVALPDTDTKQGEVMMTSPASTRHQLVGDFLLKVVGTYVEAHNLGVVLSAPFQMKLEHSGREPDLLFVATTHLDRLKANYLDGPADLAVEIISPESIGRDRGTKFVEYAQGGVPEYWLLDPQARRAEFYRLGEMGQYEIAFAGREGRYEAHALPGFWLRVEWLWQEPLPPTLAVLRELALI